ncbi:MAG: radical SAM family heme chaperone HemW [Desulfovibrionaceae bacterium]
MPRFFGEPLPPKRGTKPVAPRGDDKGRKALLLYIHVPFCRSRCNYCSFHSQAFNQVTYAWYLKTLLAEIKLWGQRLGAPRLETVYFGGGTPSLAPLGDLDKVLTTLRKHFSFTENMEITLEANPDSAQDVSWFRGLLSMGVNRLSLGVQSLSDDDLARLGRPHSARMAVESFSMARQAGFANISLDMIWGLPLQRLRHWLDQLKTIARLGAEHLSSYGLSIEPGTPLHRMSLEQDLDLAQEQEQAKMFVYGAELLESLGYLQYEISNFARMGFQSRHNSGYWQSRDYLGLGPSAVSTLGRRRFTNPTSMDEYEALVRSNNAGRDFEELDDQARLLEMVMLSLRTTKGLDLRLHRERAGFDLVKTHQKLIQALVQNGLLRINRGMLRLTKEGMAVSNVVIERLAFAEPPASQSGAPKKPS